MELTPAPATISLAPLPAEPPPSVASKSIANPDLLWKQYAIHVDLYKFYLDLILKAVAFFYAATGGITSYVLAKGSDRMLGVALLLPVAMSVALAVIFLYGARLMRPVRDEVFAIRDALGLDVAPDLGVLSVFLYVFAAVLLVTGIGLGVLAYIRWPV